MKTCLVTGGASGIGAAIVKALAREDCRVIVNYRSKKSEAESLCQFLNAESSTPKAIPFYCDCSSANEVDSMFKYVSKNIGPLNVLINNAGFRSDNLSVKMSEEQFSSVLIKNINCTFLCSKAAILHGGMLKNGGRIVNMSSVVGQVLSMFLFPFHAVS